MSNSHDSLSRSPGFFGTPRMRLGWWWIGLTTTFLALFVLWLLDVKAMPVSRPMFFFHPLHAFLLLGTVAAERYRIVRPLAQGGLGAVFVAHDEELHREVALKEILNRHAHNAESRERFVLEAEVTGGLEHPGIVPVYGLGEYQDGRPYYAMRFIHGHSLKRAIAEFHHADSPERDPGERALAMRRMLTHFVDVCEAMAYAHSRGVLHRDIKPDNIMLGKFGETLVVDWGLAKPLGRCFAQDGLPRTGIVVSPGIQADIVAIEANGGAGRTTKHSHPGTPGGQSEQTEQPLAHASLRQLAATLDQRPSTPPILGDSAATLDQRPSTPPILDDSAATLAERPGVPAALDRSAETLAQPPISPAALDRSAETLAQPPISPAALDRSAETLAQPPIGPAALDRSAETLAQPPIGPAALDRSSETVAQSQSPALGLVGEADGAPKSSHSGPTLDPTQRPLVPSSVGRSSKTLAGSRMGTPSFMSPEQAAGHVDQLGPASDIYSLGATLYNILTGVPPISGGNLTKILARVVAGNFPPPRKVKPSTPPALEAIVLKAMALKPEDRYPTSKALSEDLEHWMADEPVWAYRDPWPARIARWGRRHKTTVGVTAALLLAAVLSLSTGSILLERERARTDRERKLAVKNYTYAYEAVETMLSQVGDVDLADIPQMEPVRRELLETAKHRFDNLLEQQSEDPEIRLLEGRTRARLGGVLEMIGQYGDAERNDQEAIESLGALAARSPADDRPLREIARAHHALGLLLRKLNRFREAESELREAVRLREQLAAKSTSDHAAVKALADSRYQLGALLARLAGRPQDQVLYMQAIKDQEAELLVDSSQPENRIKLAQYRNNLAMLQAKRDPMHAEQQYREILKLLAGLNPVQKDLPGARWQIARASNNLAMILKENPTGATQLLAARKELERLAAEFPQIRQYRRELALVFYNLGRLALKQDKPDDDAAAVSFGQAARLLKELADSDPQVPDYQQNRSIVQFQLELLRAKTNVPAAKEGMARVLADQEDLIATYPKVPDYRNAQGRNLVDYGRFLLDHGEASEALRLADKAIERFRDALLADPGNLTYTRNRYDAHVLKLLIALAMKDSETAALHAETLLEVLPDHLNAYLTASMGLADCIVLVRLSEKLTSEARERRSEAYAQRAVELLRQAVDRQLLNSPKLLLDKAFEPLFKRPEFRNLIQELLGRQQPVTG